MNKLPRLDLDVVDIKRMVVTDDASGETVLTIEIVGGQRVDLHLAPYAKARLEAFLARASLEQAKRAPMQ